MAAKSAVVVRTKGLGSRYGGLLATRLCPRSCVSFAPDGS